MKFCDTLDINVNKNIFHKRTHIFPVFVYLLFSFSAHASLFRGQHITTFDGRHFDYKGTCSYLMARDFVDGKFTVVANFDPDRSQRTIKSITVITAYNKEIEIFSDYKVIISVYVFTFNLFRQQ